jgi:hypothetical protein
VEAIEKELAISEKMESSDKVQAKLVKARTPKPAKAAKPGMSNIFAFPETSWKSKGNTLKKR